MAVAKYKLEIDRKLREAGCTVKSGRVYRPDGVFWGTRSDALWFAGRDPEKLAKTIAAIAQHQPKKEV